MLRRRFPEGSAYMARENMETYREGARRVFVSVQVQKTRSVS